MKFHNNRSHNLTSYLEQFGWQEVPENVPSDFSLHGGDNIVSKVKVWPKQFWHMVDNLWIWHSLLRTLKLEHLAPETILEWDKVNLEEKDFNEKSIWFFKNIFGVHGKGINLFSKYNEYIKALNEYNEKTQYLQGACLNEELNLQYVLQKCIFDTHLIKGRKYILRVYTLSLGNGSTFIYNDCFYYSALFPKKYDYKDCYIGKNNKVYPLSVKNKHNKTFVPKEQMRINVHVSHWHPDRESKFNIVDNRIMGILSELPIYKKVMQNLFRNTREMSKLQENVLNEYVDCKEKPINVDLDNIYQIWGSDYIVEEDLSVKCVEINGFPNLSHGDPYKGASDAKVRPHEVKFRKNGFDRDLMRRLGFNLENTNVENNWVLLNQANLNIPIEELHLQKLKKVRKSRRKRKSKSRRKRKSKSRKSKK